NYLPTPLIELSNLHFASESVGYGLLDFLGVLSRPDFRFAVNEEAQFGSVFSRRAVRLLRSFFVSSFSTTRSAMAMSFPTLIFSIILPMFFLLGDKFRRFASALIIFPDTNTGTPRFAATLDAKLLPAPGIPTITMTVFDFALSMRVHADWRREYYSS